MPSQLAGIGIQCLRAPAKQAPQQLIQLGNEAPLQGVPSMAFSGNVEKGASRAV